jgi:molybdopterin-synthase adenylyltransferase
MPMRMARFDRNMRFFGEEGQNRLRNTTVALVGAGGLGSHVIQQLCMLGVGTLSIIDADVVDDTSRNRLIGAEPSDAAAGTLKVDVGERLAKSIDPTVGVLSTPIHSLASVDLN